MDVYPWEVAPELPTPFRRQSLLQVAAKPKWIIQVLYNSLSFESHQTPTFVATIHSFQYENKQELWGNTFKPHPHTFSKKTPTPTRTLQRARAQCCDAAKCYGRHSRQLTRYSRDRCCWAHQTNPDWLDLDHKHLWKTTASQGTRQEGWLIFFWNNLPTNLCKPSDILTSGRALHHVKPLQFLVDFLRFFVSNINGYGYGVWTDIWSLTGEEVIFHVELLGKPVLKIVVLKQSSWWAYFCKYWKNAQNHLKDILQYDLICWDVGHI